MFTQNEYVDIQINREARQRALREAETLRLLRSANLPRAGLAARLGRALMALGQRLAHVEERPLPSDSRA